MTLPPFPPEVSKKLQEIAVDADARRAADFMHATARARDEAVARIRDLATAIDLY